VLYSPLSTTPSPKTATDSGSPKIDRSSTKTKHSWHHQVNKKHYYLRVKFEVMFATFFSKKSHVQQKVTLFMRDESILFFKKRRLEKLASFWFSELEDVRNTWCLRR
jgi:hypothetical protein